jgi:hypothetical protein
MEKGYFRYQCGCVFYFEDIGDNKMKWEVIVECDDHCDKDTDNSGVSNHDVEYFKSDCVQISKKEAAIAKMRM